MEKLLKDILGTIGLLLSVAVAVSPGIVACLSLNGWYLWAMFITIPIGQRIFNLVAKQAKRSEAK